MKPAIPVVMCRSNCCRAITIVQIDKCFGFETSVERSQGALMAAKVEARSTRRGIGLVKLMGRSSGFITMQASMASGELRLRANIIHVICSRGVSEIESLQN